MKLKLLTTIFTLLVVLSVQAIEIRSRMLGTDAGLPDNNVRSIAIDDKGYIWLGTPNGLYRYDGYTFTTFHYTGEGNMRLLNNNHITGIRRRGQQLVIREQGNMYSVFDTHLNHFVEMEQTAMETMFADKQTDWRHSTLTAPYRDVLQNGGNVIEDNKGNPVVIDTKGLLWHIDKQTGQTAAMRVFDERLFTVVSSHKYKVWLTDDERLIWVSTNGCGITVYDRVTGSEQHIREATGLIATDYILDIAADQWGNVWAVNEFLGLTRLTALRTMPDLRLLEARSKELRSNQVYIMHQMADSTLLVANTKGEVWMADRWGNLTDKPTYTGLDVHAVLSEGNGDIWIGSRQQGLRAPDGRWYRHDAADPTSIGTNNVFCLLRDRDGNLWVAGEQAPLDLAVRQSDGSYRFRHFMKGQTTIRVMTEDSKGDIWVGAKSGLYRFRAREIKNDSQAYSVELTEKEVKYSDISCIYEDSHGRLWVGTIGGGVFVRKDGAFSNLTTADGLISNEVHSLTADRRGTIWIATNRGITCYNPENGSCRYVYNEDSPTGNYYSDNCVSVLPDGRLAFGTNYGIRVFNPTDGETGERGASRLAFTGLQINGVAIEAMGGDSPLNVAPDDADEIVLAHDQNSLTFHFSTFNAMGQLATRYSYRLEGYDREWSEPSVYNFANYKNLKPGKYVLHVKAYDMHSTGSSEREIHVTIRHPWWSTWWAYIIYAIIVSMTGFGVYRQLRTVYDLRRRITIEKALTEYKLVFFTNISHEFRTPLTIIRGAMDRIRASRDIPAELRQSLSNMGRSTDRMLRLINQLLEFRKMQSGKLQLALEDTDVIAFVRDIYQDFSDLADNKHINYNFTSNVKTCEMAIDRQHVDKIVYNLLSNAFKYTPSKGSITVRVREEGELLTIRVEDTGVGIPKEKQPELFERFMQSSFTSDSIGIGLHLTKALAERHHGSIAFEENTPQGSAFTVTLPTNRSVYQPEDFLQQSELEATVTDKTPVYQEVMGEPMNDRHVLIVEDDADVAGFLKQTLGPYFYVDVAMDGASALETMEEQVPDLVVSDVMMPVMNGFELTRRIRANEQTQTVPIILLTALNSDDSRLKGVKHGADAYLTKPFDTRLLISTCRQLIEQREKTKSSNSSATYTATPPEIIVEERDKRLLEVMNAWLANHISDPLLSVDSMAEAMGYRRSVFFRKVKSLTGQTPADYIRTLRMNMAAEMLRSETITVAEVCYKVGISDPHYFTKVFKQQFGISPKKYQQGKHAE